MPHARPARSFMFNQLYIHSKSAWVRLKELLLKQNSYFAGRNLTCSPLYHTPKTIRFVITKAYGVILAIFQKKSTATLENLPLSLYLAFMELSHRCFLCGRALCRSFYSSPSHTEHPVHLRSFGAAFTVSLSCSSFAWG